MQVSELVERLKKLPAGADVTVELGEAVGDVVRIDEEGLDGTDPFVQLIAEEL